MSKNYDGQSRAVEYVDPCSFEGTNSPKPIIADRNVSFGRRMNVLSCDLHVHSQTIISDALPDSQNASYGFFILAKPI
jgi:hypothetical protein